MIDGTYIIGVIRAKERELLQSDEYTRITDAPSAEEAMSSLLDTTYGQWLKEPIDWHSVSSSIEQRLASVIDWLVNLRGEEDNLVQFIMLRSQFLIQTTEKISKSESVDEKKQLLKTHQVKTIEKLTKLAKTPLAKKTLELLKERLAEDKEIRENINAGKKVDVEELETGWDQKILDLLTPYKWEPIQDDAILAYWLTLELEAKKIRTEIINKIVV